MKGKVIPFDSVTLKPYDCYYEVRERGQVFRVISKEGEVLAEEPTGTDKNEAMFAMTLFEGVAQYKMEEKGPMFSSNKKDLSSDMLNAQVHFIKLLGEVEQEVAPVTFTDARGERSDVETNKELVGEENDSYKAYMAPKPSIFKQIFTKIKHLFVKRE